jgi:hypothetical protein
MANRDLAGARRYVDDVPANQQNDPDLQRVETRLARLESQRDAALQRANSCATARSSTCVARNANQALALDARNPQALALARRAARTKPAPARQPVMVASPAPAPEAHPNPPMRKPDTGPSDQSSFKWFGWGVPTVAKGRGDAH